MGPGGFGGPMMMGMQQSLLSLLMQPEVQAEIQLTDPQRPPLEKLQGDMEQAIQEQVQQFDPATFFTMDDEERERVFADGRAQMEQKLKVIEQRLDAVLSADQLRRLRELSIQREGILALRREEISASIALTESQSQKLDELEDRLTFPPRMPPRGPAGFFGGPPDFQKLEQDRRDAEQEFLGLLTPQQLAKWETFKGKPFTFAPLGFPGPGGPMGGPSRKLVKKFDKNEDGWLNRAERDGAREEAKKSGGGFGPRGGGRGGPPGMFGRLFGGRGGRGPGRGFGGPPGGPREPGKPGVAVQPTEVAITASEELYDPAVVRTLFLTFAQEDWESELADFKPTDIEVDATLMVDGKVYEKVGVSFRGASSFGMVPEGSKRSLNISLDMADKDQRLLGYKTLNLLNSNGDPTLMHSVLYSQIARKYLPTPRVNEVRLVINGEDWGIYQNAQQFDKIFLEQEFGSAEGARWKVPGSPAGGGSLTFLGEEIEPYRRLYEIKSADKESSWQALVDLCRVLNQTPIDQLKQQLEPILDVDGVLRFLALDVALINEDGYWVRGSDYSLFQDAKGKFHVIPHDMNESFMAMGGPGMGGPGMGRGMRGRGSRRRGPPGDGSRDGRPWEGRQAEEGDRSPEPGAANPSAGGPESPFGLDPLIGLDQTERPLRSRLLQVPEWRERYLEYVGQIAERDLDWAVLGPMVAEMRARIEPFVELDSRKLTSFEEFQQSTNHGVAEAEVPPDSDRILHTFAQERRAYLLAHPEVQAALAE
jgi:spore coat protein CotH